MCPLCENGSFVPPKYCIFCQASKKEALALIASIKSTLTDLEFDANKYLDIEE